MFYDDASQYAFESAQQQLQAGRQVESVVEQVNRRADDILSRGGASER